MYILHEYVQIKDVAGDLTCMSDIEYTSQWRESNFHGFEEKPALKTYVYKLYVSKMKIQLQSQKV